MISFFPSQVYLLVQVLNEGELKLTKFEVLCNVIMTIE